MDRNSGASAKRASKLEKKTKLLNARLKPVTGRKTRSTRRQLAHARKTLAGSLSLRQSFARCRGNRQVPALPSKSSRVGQTVMNPCRTRCHWKHGFCSFQSGAKHLVLNATGTTRLPNFPKRLVHALGSELICCSPFAEASCVGDGCCAQGSVGKEILKRGWPAHPFGTCHRCSDERSSMSFQLFFD